MNLEKLLFNMSADTVMHNMKNELLLQINQFDIVTQINGFVVMNGKFFVGVSQIPQCNEYSENLIITFEILIDFLFLMFPDGRYVMHIHSYILAVLYGVEINLQFI